MAREFDFISTKNYNGLINDDGTGTFPNNLGEFTENWQGNQGELSKVIREFGLSVTVNEFQNITMIWNETSDAIFGTLTSESINWINEGLFDGASVDVIFNKGNKTVSAVVLGDIGGNNKSVLRITKAALTALKDGEERTDITLKLRTAPKWFTFKYGFVDATATSVDFNSQIDSSEQAYYAKSVATSPAVSTMRLVGNNTGSDMTTALTVKFDGTDALYFHKYTVAHTFRVPFYTEGEFGNILTGSIPRRTRPINMKYCTGYEFGGTTSDTVVRFEDIGNTANSGYFGSNFNGRENFYSVDTYAISNARGTDVIEAREANTITFKIQPVAPAAFAPGVEIILVHSKLPTQNQAQFKQISFDDTWLFEEIRIVEGAGAVAGTKWSAVTASIGAGGELDVTATLAFSLSDQDRMSVIDNNLIFVTVATQDLADPDNVDRSNNIAKGSNYGKDPDITGIVTVHQNTVYPESEFDGGVGFTNENGYNADLLGYTDAFTVDLENAPLLTGVRFMVVMYDGTDHFELFGKSIPITNVQTVNVSGDQRQILNVDVDNDFNIPLTDLLNRVKLEALDPGSPGSTQNWTVSLGFQIPWREFILNTNIPTSFIDYAEPNNNQNNRTSNYSGVSGFTINTLLRLQFQTDDPVNQISNTTFYNLFGDNSAILDFDDPGISSFVLTWAYFDSQGDPTSNLFINQDGQIDAKFAHTLGTLLVGNLFGYMWIIEENSTGQPWFLSTDNDYTNQSNPLQPSDTLMTSNTQFVEIISTLNQVILRCNWNKDNLDNLQNYKVYARLYPK